MFVEWWRRLALAAGSMAIGFLLFELGLRAVESSSPPRQWYDRPTFYYQPTRSKTLDAHTHSSQKPRNGFRIGVVGDSFSFAPFMQFDDAFPKRMERILNLNAQRPVEVINYGIPGASTVHELETIRRAIESDQLDLVLLQVTLNDPELKPYRPTGIVVRENRFGAATIQDQLPSWAAHSRLLSLIYGRFSALSRQREYVRYFQDLFTNYRSRQSFFSAVFEINKLCKRKQVPLRVVIFPLFGTEVDDSYPFFNIHQKIAVELSKANIRFLDLLELYRGIPVERLQVMPGEDYHPNEIAHRMAADAIVRWFAKTKDLPTELLPIKLYARRDNIINCDTDLACCENPRLSLEEAVGFP